jgi:ABC-2 type transport system permease protein
VKAQDAQISIAFNQSFFSVGNTISSAMLVSTLNALADYAGQNYLANNIPYLDVPTAHVKISTLYNPSMSYEFYLEPSWFQPYYIYYCVAVLPLDKKLNAAH